MEIVDAQLHAPIPLAPWNGEVGAESELVVAAELAVAAMEAVGVDAAVMYSSLEACEVAIRRYPLRFAGVLSLQQPRDIPDPVRFIADLRARPGMLAIRLMPGFPYSGEHVSQLADGLWEPTLAAAERQDLPVVLFIPLHLGLVNDVAAKHPDLRIVVDHLGMPTPPGYPRGPLILDTLPELLALARFPNVAVKFSAAPALSMGAYPFADLWTKLHRVIEAFTPERLMWGSDYTRVTGRSREPRNPDGRSNYGELVNFLRYTNEVSESDKAVMFSSALRSWFRWPAPAGARP